VEIPKHLWIVITKEGADLAAHWPEACHEHINEGLMSGDYYKGAIVREYRLVENEKVD
jgi:hypothetical protein